MKKIQLTKRGIGTVSFIQVVEGSVGLICNGISQTLTTEEANRIYGLYVKNGWTVKYIPEKPSMAPQIKSEPVEKPMSKNEAIKAHAIKKYGEAEYNQYKVNYGKAVKAAKSEINEWVKSHRRLTKDEYKAQIQKGIKKYMAQYQAEALAM